MAAPNRKRNCRPAITACEARTATDLFRKRRDLESAASDLRSFVLFHTVNYHALNAAVRPFDKLPTELILYILSHVANHNLRLEADVISPHIFKARLLQRRVAHIVADIIRHKFDKGFTLEKQFPADARSLRNFVTAADNVVLRPLLSQIYVPVALQTLNFDTVSAWSTSYGVRPIRQHTGWALRPTPIRDFIGMYKEARGMHRALTDNYDQMVLSFKCFENLRSLKIRTIPPPCQEYWKNGPVWCDAPAVKPFLGSSYDHVALLFDLVSASELWIQTLEFIGLAPALLEQSFSDKLSSWSFLEDVSRLTLFLLQGEDFEHVDQELFIKFLTGFHSLEILWMQESSLRNSDSEQDECSVEEVIEIFYIRPRPFLHTLVLRCVWCYGWSLRRFFEQHQHSLESVELQDVTLFDTAWYRLLRCLRRIRQKTYILDMVDIRESCPKGSSGSQCFFDDDDDHLMREIVVKYGRREGGQINVSAYVTKTAIGTEDNLSSSTEEEEEEE